MKVLILNGSPHINGGTARALKEVEQTLKEEGVETETILVGNKDIRGCIGCYTCEKNAKCIFDDEVNEIAKKFEKADGIIIGSPVYYAGSNGTIISLLDRLFYSSHFDKTMKVGASVITSRRAGSTSVFDEINKYFTFSAMPIVSSTYWNEVHGGNEKEVEKDKEGLQTMRNLGKNMAFMIKSINLGKEKYGIPKLETNEKTSFIDNL